MTVCAKLIIFFFFLSFVSLTEILLYSVFESQDGNDPGEEAPPTLSEKVAEDATDVDKEAQPMQSEKVVEDTADVEKEALAVQVVDRVEDRHDLKKEEAQPIQVVDKVAPRVDDRIENHKTNGTDHDAQPTKPPLEEVCTNPEQGEGFRSISCATFLSLPST